MNKYSSNLIKIVLAGPTGSGKSSILNRYINNNFCEKYSYTVGVDFKYKLININNRNIKLHFWDTCGLKHFRDLIKLYYNDANVIIYIFDINDNDSINECIDLINNNHIRPDIKLYLIGNKLDLYKNKNEKEYILDHRLKNICDEKNIKFFLSSAKSGENIIEIFNDIIENNKFNINNININIGNSNNSYMNYLDYFKIKC